MFLTASNLAHYCIMRGIVAVTDIVNGDFVVLEAERQNRNFKVRVGKQRGVFLKQIKELGVFAEARIRKEATCYRAAKTFPEWAAHIPEFIAYDESRHCLAIELLPRGENMKEIAQRCDEFPLEIARLLGQALARYQSCLDSPASIVEEAGFLPQHTPWILTYHLRSLFPEGAISEGALQFGAVIRGLPKLQEQLARLRREWRFEVLMHGDMKWDNCVVYPDANGDMQLKIIDWELVDFGDASWDVAGVFQSFITHGIMKLFPDTSAAVADVLNESRQRMPALFAPLRAFWTAYVATRKLDEQVALMHLLRCVKYSAVRLLQTAFESLFNSSTVHNYAAALLSLSQTILDDPTSAAVELLGFSEEAGYVLR